MSYEGSYIEFLPNDQPLTEKEISEIIKATSEIRGWILRKDDEWIKDVLGKNYFRGVQISGSAL